MQQSTTAYSVVKYAGAAYLIYLGIKTLLDSERFTVTGATAQARLGSVFSQAVASNVRKSKLALFFLAFLPQFADPTAGDVAQQLLVLGLTFALLTWLTFSALGYASGSLGSWLISRPKLADGLR